MKSTIIYLLICFSVIFVSFSMNEKNKEKIELSQKSNFKNKDFASMKMFDLIEKYSDEYSIPKYIAYNVSYLETSYRGPFDWSYNPNQESCVGAVGPMQVLPSTCNWINKSSYSKRELMYNLELNIMTSMKLLNKLYLQYKDWSVVCGWYNTGRPIVNDYGKYCANNKDYKSKWLKI